MTLFLLHVFFLEDIAGEVGWFLRRHSLEYNFSI